MLDDILFVLKFVTETFFKDIYCTGKSVKYTRLQNCSLNQFATVVTRRVSDRVSTVLGSYKCSSDRVSTVLGSYKCGSDRVSTVLVVISVAVKNKYKRKTLRHETFSLLYLLGKKTLPAP